MRTTVGQLLINKHLPEDLRDYSRPLDKKGTQALLREVADRYPDRYKKIVQDLADLGHNVAYSEGSSIGLADLQSSTAKKMVIPALKAKIKRISEDDRLDQKEKERRILAETSKLLGKLDEAVLLEAAEKGNKLAIYAISGARGNKSQLNQMLGSPLLVQDHKDRPIPVPILSSFSEGLDPAELWASSYGVRKGYVDVKQATPKAGFFGKQLANAAHRLIVRKEDPLPGTGMPVATGDPDNEGSILAQDYGGYKAGTILTPDVLKQLKRKHKKILVHSPIAAPVAGGGIPQKAVGVRERGIPVPGDNVGIAAAQAISEPLAQAAISCLAEGTRVRMADFTVKPIEDVEVGDRVLGSDVEGRISISTVTRTYDQGIQPCWEFVFRHGSARLKNTSAFESLVSTAEHKVLGRHRYGGGSGVKDERGIFKVGSINKKSGLYLSSSFDDSGYIDEPRAVLLGVLLGDGCYTKSVRGIFLSCADESQIDWLNKYIRKMGMSFNRLPGHNGIYYRLSQVRQRITNRDSKTGRIKATSVKHPIKRWFADLGVDEKYAYEKTIPSCVHSWSNKSVSELLAGLWVSGGSVFVTKEGVVSISFASTSAALVESVRGLMSVRFGIHFGTIDENDYGERKRTLYSITKSQPADIKRFNECIPLFGRKKCILQALVDSGLDRSWEQHKGYMPIVGKEKVGDRHVYDIEIDHPDHLFLLANGMIVSNSKHIAGVAGATGGGSSAESRQGFEAVNRLANIPKHYEGRAPVTTIDGEVTRVEDAPQGGKYVHVGEKTFYVSPDQDVIVKQGQKLEAGDVLSSGLPNPADVVRHKGIGEGRRYFVNIMRDVLQNSGVRAHRRNLELVSRSLINHVRMTGENGPTGSVPDDIVEYDDFAARYVPRQGAQAMKTKLAKNKYLEQPVLHYSIGTRITPRVMKELQEHGIKEVMAHDQEPDFQPEMQRAMEVMSRDPDWMTRMGGFHLQKNILEQVHRGGTSQLTGSTSYIPSLARGVEFGRSKKGPY